MVGAMAAVALALSLGAAGCVDGTVRTPPGEAQERPRPGGDVGHRQGSGQAAAATVTIAAVGDTAMGVTPTLPPDPASYFAHVEGELKGDVVFANLEGTLTDVSESPKCGPESSECFAFRAPPEYAEYLADA